MRQEETHDVYYYSNRAFNKFVLKDYIGAIESYSKAIELRGSDALLYFNRAIARLEANQKKEAMMDLLKAHELGLSVPQDVWDRLI
jgi:tetratricopeptide (TPR) repeat protein